MQISDAMIEAAIQKAIEAGLLPRSSNRYDYTINRDIMRGIIEAALEMTGYPESRNSSAAHYRKHLF